MKKLLVGFAVVVMAGCATSQAPEVVHLKANYDSVLAKNALSKGDNKIEGSAFLRQRGGGIVTCAGEEVLLIPKTDYAVERLEHIYQGPVVTRETSLRRVGDFIYRPLSFIPDYPEYSEDSRKTVCDAQGAFAFNNVKPGHYFVVTSVLWQAVGDVQGGSLATLVTVTNDENDKVILSR